LLRLERIHVHVSAGGPLGSGDVPQPGRGQVEATPAVWKGADNLRPAPDFLHDALQRIVRPDLDPVAVRERVESQRLADAVCDQFACVPWRGVAVG